MNINIHNDGSMRQIECDGTLSYRDKPAIDRIVECISEDTPSRCVLRMERLERIDSAGLGMLLLIKDVAERIGTELILKGITGKVSKLMMITEFSSMMRIEK